MQLSAQTTFGLTLMLVFWMCLKSSDALTCYECNSYMDKRCLGTENYELSDDLKRTCPEKDLEGHPYKLCRKIRQSVDFEVNGLQAEHRVIRMCGWDDSHYKNKCYQRSGFGGRQEVCACDTSDCNSGVTVMASTLLLVAMFGLLRM